MHCVVYMQAPKCNGFNVISTNVLRPCILIFQHNNNVDFFNANCQYDRFTFDAYIVSSYAASWVVKDVRKSSDVLHQKSFEP